MPPLAPTAIDKNKLLSVEIVLMKYVSKLKVPCRAGTLSVKLSCEVVFGPEVLQQCTMRGCWDLPTLPSEELVYLKEVMITQLMW